MQQKFEYDDFNYDQLMQDGEYNNSLHNIPINIQFDYNQINFLSQQQKPKPLDHLKDIRLEIYLTQVVKAEQIQQTSDCNYELSQLDPEFIQQILVQDFMKYCQRVILPRKKLFLNIPCEKVMQHQKDELSMALIIGPFQDMQKISKQIFQLILQFSQDQTSTSPPLQQVEVQKILAILEGHNQLIIDELYFQLIKQMIQNNQTIMLYAQLLSLVCSLYPPSLAHLIPFLNFFYTRAIKEKTQALLQYWKFFIKRTCKTYHQKAKILIQPTDQEILSLMNLRALTMNIVVYGQNQIQFEIEPDSKVAGILNKVITKLEVKNITLCMIQMIAGQIEEFYLNDDQLVHIIIKRLLKSINKMKERISSLKDSQQLVERIDGSCRFVLKTTLMDLNDVSNLSIAYIVTIEDYLNGFFITNNKEIQFIAALKLTADSGNSSEHCKLYFDFKLYVPLYKQNELSEDIWLKNILRIYLKQDRITQREARKRIVDYFKSQYTFLAYRFQCRMFETVDKQSKIILQVGYNGISCFSMNSPRQPFMVNLVKAQKHTNDSLILYKDTKVLYFKFQDTFHCIQAYNLIQKINMKDQPQFIQYSTAFY